MQCDTARRLLPFARPGSGELSTSDRAGLDAHLADCPDCTAVAYGEGQADAALSQAIRDIPIPERLRERLDRSLDVARAAWWRWRAVAAGTAFVGAVLIVGSIHRVTRPTLDAFAIAQETYEQAGLWRSEKEARDSTDGWLRRQDSRLLAPPDFDYKYLAFLGRSDLRGLSSVPTLTLVRGDATARVYLVREAAFKSLGAAADQPVEEGGCAVAVRRYEELPGWLVIVVTTVRQVEWFLRKSDAGGPA